MNQLFKHSAMYRLWIVQYDFIVVIEISQTLFSLDAIDWFEEQTTKSQRPKTKSAHIRRSSASNLEIDPFRGIITIDQRRSFLNNRNGPEMWNDIEYIDVHHV